MPIKAPRGPVSSSYDDHRGTIAKNFDYHGKKDLTKKNFEDPFNPGMQIYSWICHKHGFSGGSFYIYKVGEKNLPGQPIFGVPKLLYPYKSKLASGGNKSEENAKMIKLFEKQQKSGSPTKAPPVTPDQMMVEEIDFSDGDDADASFFKKGLTGQASHYLLTDKWNGCNIQFFKYFDANDEMYVSVKTKGSATVNDTDFGSFFSLICEALGIESKSWDKKCEFKPKQKKSKTAEHQEKEELEEKEEKLENEVNLETPDLEKIKELKKGKKSAKTQENPKETEKIEAKPEEKSEIEAKPENVEKPAEDPIDAAKNSKGFPETVIGLGHDHFSLFPLEEQEKAKIPVFKREKLGVITKEFRLRDYIAQHKDENKVCYVLEKFFLNDDDVQSFDFELCGRKEPHLVKYDFGIDLKPLFFGLNNGELSPYFHKMHPEVETFLNPQLKEEKPKKKEKASEEEEEEEEEDEDQEKYERLNSNIENEGKLRQYGPWKINPDNEDEVIRFCQNIQRRDLWLNTDFRKMNNLTVKYEHDHFKHEGFVLYLLKKSKGRFIVIPRRALYKIKPPDVESVHWEQFDDLKKQQIDIAAEKMHERFEKEEWSMSILREELDIGEKEWGKFGKQVTDYVIEKGYLNKNESPRHKKKGGRRG